MLHMEFYLEQHFYLGERLQRYVAVDSASTQDGFGNLESANIDLMVSTSVLFMHSATPFC